MCSLRPTQIPRLSALANISPSGKRLRIGYCLLLRIISNTCSCNKPSVVHVVALFWQKHHASTQCEEDWLSASVVNKHLVCDSTIRQLGFDLPRQSWTLLSRLLAVPHRSGSMSCKLVQMGTCSYVIISQVVDSRQLTKLGSGLTRLNEADDDAVNWLKQSAASAFDKPKNKQICFVITEVSKRWRIWIVTE